MSSLNSRMVDLSGLERLKARVQQVADLSSPTQMRPLLDNLGRIMIEDNRRGVLAGLDGNGNRLIPCGYRTSIVRPKTQFRRRHRHFGATPPRLRNDNLTIPEYQKLTGPPLAPRGIQSRTIKNYRILEPSHSGGVWTLTGAWLNVVDTDGDPILPVLFNGGRTKIGWNVPARDIRGVRPQGMAMARATVSDFFRAILRQARV